MFHYFKFETTTLTNLKKDDGLSIAELYSQLASPQVDPSEVCNETVTRLLDYDDDLEGLGFRSVLYRYQRTSIAAMITRELVTKDIQDPLYVDIPTAEVSSDCYHLQPGTMEVLTDCGMVAPARGGLLCEELGT